MALSPFNASSFNRSSTDYFVSMRRDMEALQRQLSTGQKADTFGGLGFERRTSLDARAKLSSIEGYRASIDQADLRIKLMVQHLERLTKLGSDTKGDLIVPKFELLGDGRTFAQNNAEQRLKEALDLLNVDLAGRSLFAGRAVDTQPVETYDAIMNGSGGRDGLRTVIAERLAAETGAGTYKYGRLGISGTANSVTLTQEAAALPFGFKVTANPPTGTAVTATNGGGAQPSATLTLGSIPNDGDAIAVVLTDPAGVAHTIKLTARLSPAANETASTFRIGSTVAETTANLQQALTAAVQDKVSTVLQPQAVKLVTEAFFRTPTDLQRVPSPPETATAFAPAVPGSNIVSWYKGDGAPPNLARDTAPVRSDQSQVVGTGAQANEAGIVNVLTQLATLDATSFKAGEGAFYYAVTENVVGKLAERPENPKAADIASELANASALMKATKDRHKATEALLLDALDGVEQVSKEETAAKILELQNRLQASYQTTSILSRLSLVNYL
ncbi:MAG TPA: hypothetical protein VIL09_13305 [Microvirga sp.]|jgi:hypothetical protein